MSTDAGQLAPVVARKAAEVEALRCAGGALWAKAAGLDPAPALPASLRGGAVIAELKRRSPSAGTLRAELDVAAVARQYAEAGAAAISVLTDGPGFGGSLDDLAEVRRATSLPVLRKDFIVDPLQIAEARVAGADWVLLIAAVLDDRTLEECLAATERAHTHAIVEVHTEPELQCALDAGAGCIGINNRDLRTLTTDLKTFARLRPRIPTGILCVAESGVRGAADVHELVSAGADAVLAGEALLRADSPGALCAELVAAGHAAAAHR